VNWEQQGITSEHKRWAFSVSVPSGAVKAGVGLCAYGDTGSDWARWDDAGFYAVGKS